METNQGKPSLYAGKTVRIIKGIFAGQKYKLENWSSIIYGNSWDACKNSVACKQYAERAYKEDLPIDNNVYYGKLGDYGELIHASEIAE